MNQPASSRRILTASLVGTAIEFYDFYIYGTAAALVFGPLFFPPSDPSTQVMLAFATFALAFIARPLGAIAFGHFGDRVGRKSTLVASLMMMGGSTLLIAFLPTYASAGILATILLCVLRFGQGFGLGGEWGGAALLATENAPPGWRARFGMVPQLGAPIGFIAANGLFLLLGLFLSPDDFTAWGWRLPFVASILLVGLGLWVRLKLTETPAFAAMLEKERPAPVPLTEVVRDHGRALFCGTFAATACFAIFYLTTVFALAHGTTVLGIARETFLSLQLLAILFLALGIVVAGYASDRWTPRAVLITGSLIGIFGCALMGPMMGSGSPFLIWAYLALALFIMGLVYGPLGAWLPGLFPARVRYTGASIAFSAAGIIGGGFAPNAAKALSEWGGLGMVGLYLSAMCALSLAGLLMLGVKKAD